jgi:hypothetical protein
MNLLAISSGGSYIDLPAPAYGGYSTVPQEIVKSGRNTAGTLYKERITVKQTITVTWQAITPQQKNQILGLTAGNSFNVRYFDTTDGTVKYGLFYRGNDLEITPLVRFDGTEFVAYNVKMSMVEF